jgi:hypothetical protein
MTTNNQAPDVLVLVEKEDGAERFTIRSSQLEQIGHKLRGFSVFNSIILPLIISAATVFFTGLFQYISWANSVRLQEATDVATRAKKSSEEVTAAIGRRYYATYTFMAALRQLYKQKPKSPALSSAGGSETTGGPPIPNLPQPDPEPPQLDAMSRLDNNLNEQRFKSYYEQLKQWNETIDQLLTEVDYSLDVPAFMHAHGAPQGTHQGAAAYYQKMKGINCSASLTDELKRLRLNPNSLKLRLVGINYCFIHLNDELRAHKHLEPSAIKWTDDYHRQLERKLTDIRTMANELRCYAFQRVDYYSSLKEQSIISPYSVWKQLLHEEKRGALKHFEETAKRCNPQNRPV